MCAKIPCIHSVSLGIFNLHRTHLPNEMCHFTSRNSYYGEHSAFIYIFACILWLLSIQAASTYVTRQEIIFTDAGNVKSPVNVRPNKPDRTHRMDEDDKINSIPENLNCKYYRQQFMYHSYLSVVLPLRLFAANDS